MPFHDRPRVSSSSFAGRLALLAIVVALPPHSVLAQTTKPGPSNNNIGSSPRRVPEALNFANGLFRERLYEQAAKEYEGFLKEAKPASPEAAEGRFGLANARLFQGEYAKARAEFEEFLRQFPGHASAGTAWYRVGETAYMIGDLSAARLAFEKFTTDYPGHKHADTAWPYLGDVCLRSGDLAKARLSYEKSLQAHPEGRLADRARFGLGRALALQGKNDAALATFTTLAEKGGKDWGDRAWFQIGQVYVRTKKNEKAVEAFENVEKIGPKSPLVAESRLYRAEALLNLGRREEGEAILRAVTVEAPQNLAAQAAFALGTSRLEGGDAEGALNDLDEASKKFAKTSMAAALVFRSAEAALKLGKANEARARFLQAAEADPKDPWADDALARAARLALDERDPDEAAKLSNNFLERFPNSPLKADARLVSARAALAKGNPKEAVTTLSATLAEDKPGPATAEALRYYLGLAYRADGQSGKAAEILDALAKTPAAPIAADAQFMVGQGHVEAKRYAEAVPALEKYLGNKPDGEVADYALAYLVQCHLVLNEQDAAIKALDRLAEKFPTSKSLAPSRVRVAEAALASKNYATAAEQFGKAVAESIDPALTARARVGLGWALIDGDKPAEAAEALGAFLTSNPEDPLAPEAALARGRALEAAKQTDRALSSYAQTAEKYAKSEFGPLAELARAHLLVQAKRPAEAAATYEKFVADHADYKPKNETGPGFDAILSDWGWALIDAERPTDADKVFTRLLIGYPDSPHAADARFNLAESANQAKNHDEVIKLLTPLVGEGTKASHRLIPSSLYRLGRSQAEKGDWQAAGKTLDRLINQYSESPFRREAKLLRAEVSLEAGDFKSADESLAALQSDPADPADPKGFSLAVRRRRVQSLFALKKWKEVVEAAEALSLDAPGDPLLAEVEFHRGRALMSLARYDDARAAFSTVIEARKGGDLVARAQLMIGETYFHQKDYHEAVRQFLKVDILYDAPSWQATALLETGKAYEQLAQWADAAETYERLRSKFPDDPNAAEAKTRLNAAKSRLDGAKSGS